MDIDTPRLRLVALTLEQLQQLITAREQLEQQMGFPISPDILTSPARRAIDTKIRRMEQASVETHPWHTYWLLVTRSPVYGVGMAGFKGTPDMLGEAEIGYGIALAWQNQGYMTEAVKALIRWALNQEGCQAVIAETRRDNPASIRVLEKTGMRQTGEHGEMLKWRLGCEDLGV